MNQIIGYDRIKEQLVDKKISINQNCGLFFNGGQS